MAKLLPGFEVQKKQEVMIKMMMEGFLLLDTEHVTV